MALDVEMAAKLIKAAWYENLDAPPDKFVVVVDIDRADPVELLEPMRTQLPDRVREVGADVLYAYAQAHLEAWYFADVDNLRNFLGRGPGHVDTSKPDEIVNPKHQLRQLLGERLYTARVSAEIAETLDVRTIAQRSPSFRTLVTAVTNGSGDAVAVPSPGAGDGARGRPARAIHDDEDRVVSQIT